MRATIYRVMMRPWVYRITCGVLFVVLMGLVRYGLHVLRENSDRSTFLVCCACALAAILLACWLIDRHNARPH